MLMMTKVPVASLHFEHVKVFFAQIWQRFLPSTAAMNCESSDPLSLGPKSQQFSQKEQQTASILKHCNSCEQGRCLFGHNSSQALRFANKLNQQSLHTLEFFIALSLFLH